MSVLYTPFLPLVIIFWKHKSRIISVPGGERSLWKNLLYDLHLTYISDDLSL